MACPFCGVEDLDDEEEGANCRLCRGEGDFLCDGNADPAAFMDTDDPEAYWDLAKLLLLCRERQWTPDEYLAQPAVFIQAFEATLGLLSRLFEEKRQRERARIEQEMKRS